MVSEILGSRIALLRKQRNLYQNDLAEILGVSKSSVAMWESGKRDPGSDVLVKLAHHFNVSSDYLLGLTENPLPIDNDEIIKAIPEITVVSKALQSMSQSDRTKLLSIINTVFEPPLVD